MSPPEARNRELIEAMGLAAARGSDLAFAAIRKVIQIDPTGDELALAARIYAALRGAVVILSRHESRLRLDSRREAFTRVGLEYDGRTTISVYTNAEVAPADLPHVVMPFAELCKQIAPMGLAVHVNPGTVSGGIAPPNWIQSIAAGSSDMPNPVVVASTAFDPAVHLADARVAELKAPLRQRLTQGLIANSHVSAAYLVRTTIEGQGALVLGAVLDSGLAANQREALTRDLFAWVESLLEAEEMYFLLFDSDDEVLGQLKAVGSTFYRKN
ncbi:MAG: hypothetical protein QOD06_2090 [Candidatus Binatota bacterium]|jgi:hypothetical protein|nr:hypothetical protein [Candidatus Binatota bacterium]